MIPVPLGLHMKPMPDEEIIHEISWYEARKEYYKWTINEATLAYYDALVGEWKRRYGNKHIPRKVYTKNDIREYCNNLFGVSDEIEL